MIDIHSHILPYMDDGARNWEEALQMARKAYEDGIRVIVATPHHANGHYMNPGETVITSIDEMNCKLSERDIGVTVVPGQEIRYFDNLLRDWNEGKLLSLNESRYILIEMPSSHVPKNMGELIHELSLLDLRVVIAHPERNQEIACNPSVLEGLVVQGALSQVTSHSITGVFGSKLKKIALTLCRNNLVHFVASDAHNLERRPFQLSDSYTVIARKFGQEMTQYLQDNAVRLIHNEPIRPRQTVSRIRSRPRLLANLLSVHKHI